MIASIDSEKTCDKIQHSFVVKTHMKLGRESNFISLIKDAYKELKGNNIVNGERLNVFPQDQEQGKVVGIHNFFLTLCWRF